VWVKNEEYAPITFALNENVKLAFDAKGIRFSHPPLAQSIEA